VILPPGMFRTIVADPPWDYDRMGKRHRGRSPRPQAQDYYNVMTMGDLLALPVSELADPTGSHLYLWTTNAFMEEAHILAKVWGFRPITIVTWVKNNIGTGWYFRGQTEHMVFAVRGVLPIAPESRSSTVFYAPAVRHSEKPALAFTTIEKASPSPRIELFARSPRDGWTVWGEEAV
jgi:N6-adenosine-specific RNA methylase IME4